MLNYDMGISLMTSPLPPLDLPSTDLILEPPIGSAIEFITQKGLEVVSQDGNPEQGIQGLWVTTYEENPGIYYGYIPIEVSEPITDVPFETKRNDPLRTDSESELEQMRTYRKIAEFLKQYTLYTYSLSPDTFSEESFTIVPDHTYDLDRLKKRYFVEGNTVMYSSDGKIIVTSEEVRDRLMSYLSVQIVKDPGSIAAIRNTTSMIEWYQSIPDFRVAKNQLIFLTKNALVKWRDETLQSQTRSNMSVSTRIITTMTDPYFYRNPDIRSGSLVILQNVKNAFLDRAISVAYKWAIDKINMGYGSEILPNIGDISYVIYTHSGKSETHKKQTDRLASVYSIDHDAYCAMLFL